MPERSWLRWCARKAMDPRWCGRANDDGASAGIWMSWTMMRGVRAAPSGLVRPCDTQKAQHRTFTIQHKKPS